MVVLEVLVHLEETEEREEAVEQGEQEVQHRVVLSTTMEH
jgi:hypothetical protein